MEVAQPGDIIVIDAKGSCNNGVWGDNRSRVAKAIGLAGVVIDGAFRDIEENEALGFPIYARANTCGRSTRGAKGEVNVPISCGGVSVRPGDIIVGDRNGVVVIPLEHAEEIIQAAQEQVDKMEAQIAKFEATGQIVPDSLETGIEKIRLLKEDNNSIKQDKTTCAGSTGGFDFNCLYSFSGSGCSGSSAWTWPHPRTRSLFA